MKERVVFEANVPVTASLAYADGLKVQGRFGDQVMYSLTDGRVMYVPPVVRDKLVELGIRQYEAFAICWRMARRQPQTKEIRTVGKVESGLLQIVIADVRSTGRNAVAHPPVRDLIASALPGSCNHAGLHLAG